MGQISMVLTAEPFEQQQFGTAGVELVNVFIGTTAADSQVGLLFSAFVATAALVDSWDQFRLTLVEI